MFLAAVMLVVPLFGMFQLVQYSFAVLGQISTGFMFKLIEMASRDASSMYAYSAN